MRTDHSSFLSKGRIAAAVLIPINVSSCNELMGGGYHTYFVNSGSEANEAGFKIARQYQKHDRPGEFRFKTISRYYAYHGTTLATLDAGVSTRR